MRCAISKSMAAACAASVGLVALAIVTALSSAVAQAADYSGDVTDVRVVRRAEQHPGAALVWEPYIAQWKPKHLVVAYGAGVAGKTDMGDIYASVSTNDGDTWGEPVAIFDHNQRYGTVQFAYNNSVLYKPLGQDVVWLFCMRCPMNSRNSEDAHLAAAYSADGGLSWTPVEMAMHYTGPLIIVGGIERIMENGQPRYLLPAHKNTLAGDPHGTREQMMLSSTSLLEWRLAGYIPQPSGVFPHEGNLAPGDAEGELKLVCRTGTYENSGKALDPPRAYSSVSQDGGRTWSLAQPENDLWNSVSKAFYGRASDGTHVYVYSDGPAWSRMSLRYKLQPAGSGWSSEHTFYDAGVHNSYPTLIEVSPGDYRAVWDSGTKEKHRTHIRFGKFKVATKQP